MALLLYGDTCCDRFEAAGYPTQRTERGEERDDGLQFALGHGVGLEVHEAPALSRTGHEPLVAGDVVAIEPGLVLITDEGCELLTRFPYDLTPSP